jgi:hypothetical protein
MHEETGEKSIPYTFYEDVMVNPVIIQLNYDLVQARNQVREKFTLFSKGWTKKAQFRILFDKNDMQRLSKQIDKS